MENTSPYKRPTFAIIGHPNEGKSTIVSTLAEDDTVRISPLPGETIQCEAFPVSVNGREIIRFIDTPGFQNPRKTLSWFKSCSAPPESALSLFLQENGNTDEFSDECRLLEPISKGAGIIYVVDGSRPIRGTDKIEMEILRLTGQPRIAIINSKEDETGYIGEWKKEFLKHFNTIRIFNGHTATYLERIELLEALKAIFQDWETPLSHVIEAFKNDWANRNRLVAGIICETLINALRHKETEKTSDETKIPQIRKKQFDKYQQKIVSLEADACRKIKKLFKHNIFRYDLPPSSILHSDLFDEASLRVLGLKPKQLALAGGVTGGMLGAAVDVAAHGLTFGLFTAIGGLSGAAGAYKSREKMVKTRVAGLAIGKQKVTTGPCKNIQFMYILLDRLLIYYSHVINWAHGRREETPRQQDKSSTEESPAGLSASFSNETRKKLNALFTAIRKKKDTITETEKSIQEIICLLEQIPFHP